MRRVQYKKIIFLTLFLFLLFALPPLFVEKLRSFSLRTFSPFFKTLNQKESNEIAKLSAENHLLRLELEKAKTLLDQQGILHDLSKDYGKVIPANVIYRDAATYSSSLWINVGEEQNQRLKRKIIEKNSPVLFGKAVVGVIDHVCAHASRVRLITDSALKPAVRVFRNNSLSQKEEGWYLAKGIVHGSGAPLWRSLKHRLKGTGFNYDFADAKGSKPEGIPLIEVGDLLITTGLDGIFPPGLKVGYVTHVAPLREGGYSYDIEAIPAVKKMDELKTLYVIAKYPVREDETNRHTK